MKRIISLCMAFMLVVGLCACSDSELEEAKSTFNENVSTIEENNSSIKKEIKALKKLIKSEPLEESVKTNAKTLIKSAKKDVVKVPECPSSKEDIISENKKLEKKLDKSNVIQSLKDMKTSYKNSVAQLKQVTNPSEEFVLERMNGIANVTAVKAATEDNDPNGNLHKSGGYTSAVFFISDLVSGVISDDPVSEGTDGGGCIEVYETKEDAEKRNTYLSAFDGSWIDSGSHMVVGTVVIRTSSNLTATQQSELETNIYNSLIELR